MTPLAAALALQPPMPQKSATPIAPADVTSAYRDSQNAAMQAYAAKMQQVNALWGGLAGLGSAGILTLPKLLSPSGATLSPELANEGTTAIGNSVAGMNAAFPGLTGAAAPAADETALFGAPSAVYGAADAAAPTVAGDLAAAAPVAADATAGFTLADLLPFLALA